MKYPLSRWAASGAPPLIAWGLLMISTMSSKVIAGDEKTFTKTCGRVVAALRASDWRAFQKLCATRIVFQDIRRVYVQTYPKEVIGQMFASDWIRTGPGHDHEIQPEVGPGDLEHNDRDTFFSHLVVAIGPLSNEEQRSFENFCGYVKDSYDRHPPPVAIGLNVQGDEVKSLFGPAIEGKVASNFKWRIGLEKISGRWRVRLLTTESH